MAEIKLSKEQIEALQKCKTKEEVAKFAQENQLTDEELEKVMGGASILGKAFVTQVAPAVAYVEKEKDCIIKPPNS